MSERMTDERWLYLRSPQTVGLGLYREVCAELDRARSEKARLMKENAEKGATIKALADALLLTGGRVSDEWHDEECAHARIVLEHGGCTDECTQKREALRLAGRLP